MTLAEGVEFFEGTGAEATERVRLIQYPRNPPLLFQRREGDCASLQIFEVPTVAIIRNVDLSCGMEKVSNVRINLWA